MAVFLPACGGTSSSDLALESCTVDGSPARCGTLLVPEDRAGGDRQVPVRVVVFPATGTDRNPTPSSGSRAARAAPTSSDVPVLALNGEGDPQDPPANMAAATAVWPNGFALAVPGQGHDIDPTSAQCLIPLIESFVDAGSVTGRDTACLAEITPPSFDLTLPGT